MTSQLFCIKSYYDVACLVIANENKINILLISRGWELGCWDVSQLGWD